MLPPTCNELAPSQRTRLVKSTRKIQAVLGTTPQLTESSMCSKMNHKKLALTLAPNPAHPNRPLLLTLSTFRRHSRASSSMDYLHISPTHTRSRSNSASDRTPLSPLTPTTTRRKRMAKLARTLGENIPPELVSNPKESRRSLPERKSIPQFDPPSETDESGDTLVELDNDSKPLPEIVPIDSPSEEAIPLAPTISLPTPESNVESTAVPIRSASVRTSAVRIRSSHKRSATSGWGHRREKGWSGEWSTDNREEVLKRLRNLKL